MLEQDKKDIIIIGGGLAGLTAAVSLKEQGLNTLLLESEQRLGGRVKTVEYDGLKLEMGAEWIGKNHLRMQELCRRFNLPLLPHEVRPCLRVDEHHIDDEALPYFFQKRSKLVTAYDKWLAQQARFSEVSFRECLDGCDLDPMEKAVEMMLAKFTYGEDNISRLRAVDVCNDLKEGTVEKEDSLWIEGGNDRLINNLSEILGENGIAFNAKVISIRQNNCVEIYTDNSLFKSDQVIVALPPKAILDIDWKPELPSKIAETFHHIRYVHIAKVVNIFPDRFWPTENFGMFQPQQGVPELIYHTTLGQDNKRGALTAFAVGKNAVELCRLDDNRRKRFISEQLSGVFGGIPHILHSEVADWEGAYSVFNREAFDLTKAILDKPWINAYFAGEYKPQMFSEQGYMEGAVSSGLETSRMILNNRITI